MTELWTQGNAAKLYCLNWIADYVQGRDAVRIIDLGSGRSRNFVRLLQTFPQVEYIGIEPSLGECAAARQALSGLRATIHQGYAYQVMGTLLHEPADLVVSFSVMEHVYRRQAYLQSLRDCLKPTGYALVNYDAGHFVDPPDVRERVKNWVGPLLARLGQERYYQSFVREADFRLMVTAVGLDVVEAQSFNTHLKGLFRLVPPEQQAAYMQRWLELEGWLNAHAIPYDDGQANSFYTRNFILRRPASP
jgi:SAM-dependent methyltransferase